MDILWTSAFIDMAPTVFDAGATFWAAATDSALSQPRGSHSEFATLLPPSGDPYLRVQRTEDGSSAIHLDLHVESVDHVGAAATKIGAEVVEDRGYLVMRSPSGFVFCLVSYEGEHRPPVASSMEAPNVLDQVCIDIAPSSYERECEFWEKLTGWDITQSRLPEFRSLQQPDTLPLRFLLQRLDQAAPDAHTHAHLDIACGDHIETVARQHEALGATRQGFMKVWQPMRDPAGLEYCLTPRPPRV